MPNGSPSRTEVGFCFSRRGVSTLEAVLSGTVLVIANDKFSRQVAVKEQKSALPWAADAPLPWASSPAPVPDGQVAGRFTARHHRASQTHAKYWGFFSNEKFQSFPQNAVGKRKSSPPLTSVYFSVS